MKKLSDYIKERKLLLIILTSIIFIYGCLFVFVFKKPFLLGNDQWFQYNIFYKEWIRLVLNFFKTGSLPMYSYNMYLGTDFYSAMGYYCTGDIFLPILLIFQNNIEVGLIIETIFCVYISACSMYTFLKKYEIKKESSLILISIIYSIGGIATLYYGQYMFHRFFSFMPMLFSGLLDYFHNKKPYIFIFAVTILFLQNYYFMFPTLIFLFIFSMMLEIKQKKEMIVILKDFCILLLYIVVGFMISAVITLPSMMYLLNNSRVGDNSGTSLLWPFNSYAGMYMSLISFYPAEIIPNMFQNPSNYHTSYYSLFITILPVLGLNSYIIKKENRVELITLIILIIIACLPPLSSIMHGFSIPSLRWLFLLEFYLLILGAKGLEKEISNKCLIIIYGLYFIGFIFFFIGLDILGYIDASGMKEYLITVLISVVASLIIFIAYLKNKKLSIILTIIELVIFEGYFLYIETRGSYIAEKNIDREEIVYNQANDVDTFRYYLNYKNNNPASYINQNESLEYGFMSLTSYNSMTDYKIDLFNKLSKTSDENLEWVLQVNDPYASTMLGTKYYIVYDETELPNELDFSYAYNLNYLKVYENLNYKGFGYTLDNIKYTSDFISTKDFLDYILVDDENIDISKYTNISSSKLNIVSIYDNYLKANITLENDNILLIPLPNNSGWTIRVNGEVVKPISVNGGFIGLELKSGYNEIAMNFISPYFKEGLILSFVGIVGFIALAIIDKKTVAKKKI